MKKAKDARQTIRGAMTAMVTPFREGDVDYAAMERLIEHQIEGGMDWLVPCGTTGEAPTLSLQERERILTLVVDRSRGRIPVMAGTGTNNTATTIEQSKSAAGLGVDAVLIVTPYYNRPSQEGLFRHYAAVAEAVELPIVLYDVPIRTGVRLAIDTMVRLRERFPHIAAIKDATGSLDGMTELQSRCDLAVLCGDDVLTWPMMAAGAVGVISVISNIVPELVKSLVSAANRRDVSAALPYHRKVFDLATGLGRLGLNPIPIKTAMAEAGMLLEEFRLPLCPFADAERRAIAELLRRHEIKGRKQP